MPVTNPPPTAAFLVSVARSVPDLASLLNGFPAGAQLPARTVPGTVAGFARPARQRLRRRRAGHGELPQGGRRRHGLGTRDLPRSQRQSTKYGLLLTPVPLRGLRAITAGAQARRISESRPAPRAAAWISFRQAASETGWRSCGSGTLLGLVDRGVGSPQQIVDVLDVGHGKQGRAGRHRQGAAGTRETSDIANCQAVTGSASVG